MIYPDEEKVTYSYNLGGQLEKVRGYKSYGHDYVNRIGYDKFEQRTYLKYCNGAETFYTYEPARRRLQNLTVNAGGKSIMDNGYTYDAVSNVLSVANKAALPESGKAGGQMAHAYTYDALYRLASATGTYAGADSKTASYRLEMGYDNMHRIVSKKQHLTQQGVQFDGKLHVGYDLAYTYGKTEGKKFQLAEVKDANYRTEENPDSVAKVDNSHIYTYDANGNLVYVNTGRIKQDGTLDSTAAERKLRWDEENRLTASDDNGFVTNYWYDADGERTVKTSGEGEQLYVNSEFAGGRTNTAKFSLYVSPYLVANQGGRYTKHIYIGSQRIVSKIGDFASYGSDPRRIQYAGSETDGLSVNYKQKYSAQQQVIKDNYAIFEVPYNGTDNNDYVDGQGFCCDDGSPEAAQARALALENNFQDPDAYEKLQFYYHPDHLGSSSYITNLDGEVVQHIEYVPFGEVFIEERNSIWNTPYLFNAKEFDEETGLYYYGARYYDPRLSLWISVDPISNYDPLNSENYLDGEHNGGIYNYANLNSYIYCYQNPIKLVDPNGKQALAGAIMGGLTEYASIVGEKMLFKNKTFIEANKDIGVKDIASIGFSMATGCVSGTAKFAKFMSSNMGKRVIKEIGTNIIEGFMNVAVDILVDQRSMSFDDAKAVVTQSIINAGLGEFLPKPARKNLEEAENNVRYFKDPNYWKAKEAVSTRNAAKGLENIENVVQGTAINITSKEISKEINE